MAECNIVLVFVLEMCIRDRCTTVWKRSWMSLAQNKVYSMIGLAMKAGKLTSGEFSVEHAVKAGKAALVIVSETASENTKKKFQNMCTYYEVPLYFFGEKETLGHAMGKEFRASLAVLDEGFAKAIEKSLITDKGGSKYVEKSKIGRAHV